MDLQLLREETSDEGTIGRLFVDGVFECFTLEPSLGDGGVGCAILPGRYPVVMAVSPHFQQMLAHVQNVTGRTDILIHDGNTEKDTEGCILVGEEQLNPGFVAHSDLARIRLQTKIAHARANGQAVWLTVVNPPVAV